MPRTYPTVVERFLEKIGVVDSGCWEWQAGLNSEGYGRFSIKHRAIYAHRFSYEFFNNISIPKRLEIDHLCRNPRCVNPGHLEVVTSRENTMRGRLPEVSRQRQLTKTHCPKGHPYDEENTYHGRRGRDCRACHRIRQARRRLT